MLLSEAQSNRRERAEAHAREQIVLLADALCDEVQIAAAARVNLAGSDAVKNYQLVGPDKRKKLSGLINYYRKKPHPFTACVTDNTKRFGAEGAKKVCAVLTDLEKNTTKWRNGGNNRGLKASETENFADQPQIDEELFGLLHAIAATDYQTLLATSVSPATVKKAWSSYRKPDHLNGGSIHKINADHIVVHAKGKKHKVPFSAKNNGFVRFGSSTPMAAAGGGS